MGNTPNRNYPYPAYKKKPYYTEIVSFFNAVDTDAQSFSDSIDSLDESISKLWTTEELDIYVNASTGNDETGDGSAEAPYKTITTAYETVPEKIQHPVHLHIAAGSYTDWPSPIKPEILPGGSFSIDGSSAMSVVAGPLTIDAGGWTPIYEYTAATITVSGGDAIAWKSGAAADAWPAQDAVADDALAASVVGV